MINPKSYSRNLNHVVEVVKDCYGRYQKLLIWRSQPESILDIGIGDGRMSTELIAPILPKNLKEYIGADISEVMLQSAKETIAHPKFSTFQLDAATKNLPDEMRNRFDHVFANGLLHHVQDIR